MVSDAARVEECDDQLRAATWAWRVGRRPDAPAWEKADDWAGGAGPDEVRDWLLSQPSVGLRLVASKTWCLAAAAAQLERLARRQADAIADAPESNRPAHQWAALLANEGRVEVRATWERAFVGAPEHAAHWRAAGALSDAAAALSGGAPRDWAQEAPGGSSAMGDASAPGDMSTPGDVAGRVVLESAEAIHSVLLHIVRQELAVSGGVRGADRWAAMTIPRSAAHWGSRRFSEGLDRLWADAGFGVPPARVVESGAACRPWSAAVATRTGGWLAIPRRGVGGPLGHSVALRCAARLWAEHEVGADDDASLRLTARRQARWRGDALGGWLAFRPSAARRYAPRSMEISDRALGWAELFEHVGLCARTAAAESVRRFGASERAQHECAEWAQAAGLGAAYRTWLLEPASLVGGWSQRWQARRDACRWAEAAQEKWDEEWWRIPEAVQAAREFVRSPPPSAREGAEEWLAAHTDRLIQRAVG